MPISEQIEQYKRDGICKFNGIFSLPEINRLRSSAFVALTETSKISSRGYPHKTLELVHSSGVPSPALLFWPALCNAYQEQMRTDNRLISIVRQFLGDDVQQLNNQFYFRLPGDTDSFAWHQDIMFRNPKENYPRIVEEDGYVQTAIIVDEMSSQNGGIEFVLGSHLLGDLGLIGSDYEGLRGFNRDNKHPAFQNLPTVILEASPGDVVVWSSLTVHGSMPNSSKYPRMYLMNGFARSSNCLEWPPYLRNGSLVPLDTKKLMTSEGKKPKREPLFKRILKRI
jgi:hypothetical protein